MGRDKNKMLRYMEERMKKLDERLPKDSEVKNIIDSLTDDNNFHVLAKWNQFLKKNVGAFHNDRTTFLALELDDSAVNQL